MAKEKTAEEIADELLAGHHADIQENHEIRKRDKGWAIVVDRKGEPDEVGQIVYDKVFKATQESQTDSIAHRKACMKLQELGYKEIDKNKFSR